jgi:hypothetical protein
MYILTPGTKRVQTRQVLTSKRNECCFVSGSYCLVTVYPGLPILTAKQRNMVMTCEDSYQENTTMCREQDRITVLPQGNR